MRSLIALLMLLAINAHAALEDWSCEGLGLYYGYVAIDRDAGVPIKDRINKTVKAITVVVDSSVASLDLESDDALALLTIVYYVYATPQIAPKQHKWRARDRCLKNNRDVPRFSPTGMVMT